MDEKTLPPPDRSADGIGVVDIRPRKLLKVMTSGTDPEQVAVSHDGTQVFVANEDAGQLTVIDADSGKIVDTFKIGDEPEGVSVHPDGNLVYVTSEEDGAVYVVDLAGKKVVKSIKVGPRPRSIAFLPDGSRAYVPSENGATLSLIDTKRMATIKTIKLADGMRPMGTVMAQGRQASLRLDRPQQDGADDRHGDEQGGGLGRGRSAAVGHRALAGREDAVHGERAIRRCVDHRRRHESGDEESAGWTRTVGAGGRRVPEVSVRLQAARAAEAAATVPRNRAASRRPASSACVRRAATRA